jgi:hypothetical protein
MKYYLIENDTQFAMWMGNTEPIVSADKVVCEDTIFLCYSSSNCVIRYLDDVSNFYQRKYIFNGTALEVDAAWIEPDDTVPIFIPRNKKIKELEEYTKTVMLNGGFYANDYWWYSNHLSEIELILLKLKAIERIIAGGDMDEKIVIDGTNTTIRAMSGGRIEVSYNDVLSIVAALEIQIKRINVNAAVHEGLIRIDDFPDQYNYYSGWPPIYSDSLP